MLVARLRRALREDERVLRQLENDGETDPGQKGLIREMRTSFVRGSLLAGFSKAWFRCSKTTRFGHKDWDSILSGEEKPARHVDEFASIPKHHWTPEPCLRKTLGTGHRSSRSTHFPDEPQKAYGLRPVGLADACSTTRLVAVSHTERQLNGSGRRDQAARRMVSRSRDNLTQCASNRSRPGSSFRPSRRGIKA